MFTLTMLSKRSENTAVEFPFKSFFKRENKADFNIETDETIQQHDFIEIDKACF